MVGPLPFRQSMTRLARVSRSTPSPPERRSGAAAAPRRPRPSATRRQGYAASRAFLLQSSRSAWRGPAQDLRGRPHARGEPLHIRRLPSRLGHPHGRRVTADVPVRARRLRLARHTIRAAKSGGLGDRQNQCDGRSDRHKEVILGVRDWRPSAMDHACRSPASTAAITSASIGAFLTHFVTGGAASLLLKRGERLAEPQQLVRAASAGPVNSLCPGDEGLARD